MSQSSIVTKLQQDLTELQAELCRRSLYTFVKKAWHVVEDAEYIDGQHIEAVCAHLQAVYDGTITDLIINIPPGCSKSLLSGVFFPAWVWAQDPSKRFLLACYDARLSTRDSIKCKTLLESDWYQSHFPGMVELSKAENQKTYYTNTAGGYRLSTSVGGHGTGEHPHFIIADDPNNVKQAESANERQAVKDWWTQTMSTRGISLGSRRIVVQQRLHEGDLTGVCLELGGYEHLCLPMRYEAPKPNPETGLTPAPHVTCLGFTDWRTEEGQLLCPLQIPEEAVTKLEGILGPYGTAGQLQQRPVPRSGGIFKVEKFVICQRSEVPPDAELKQVRYWDTSTNDGTGDWTAGVHICKHFATSKYYIKHVERGRWLSDQRKARQRQTAELDGKAVTQVQAQEPGSGGADQAADFLKLMQGFTCRTKRESGDKVVRADPYASQVNAGNVILVEGEWNRAFIDEHQVAPNGANDDQWDAAAGGFNILEYAKYPSFMPSGWTFGASPPEVPGMPRNAAAAVVDSEDDPPDEPG